MKMPKSHASVATAVAMLGMALLLAGCAIGTRVPAPSIHQIALPDEKASGNTPAISPPSQRLEKFSLCYELRRSRAWPLEAPVKRFSIDVSILVPQDDCLALDANGWLRVVPGQCSRIPAQSTCEEKP